ncbi:YkvA family protein [Pontibacter vulgaris]|uniref:YkvA family protein n=1 Tax=Pontibacter vulgaris TaxID=2905679 RepID=UPI001FA80A1B|nr:YkvA family protein [Pontibacter vulgaris]
MAQLHTLKQKTQELNTELYALYLSYRDGRVQWYVRLLLAFVIGYSISPIDFVPDYVPVFGFLDDVVIVAIGLSFSSHLLSKNILGQARLQAYEELNGDTATFTAAYKIVLYAWMLIASVVAVILYKLLFMNMM